MMRELLRVCIYVEIGLLHVAFTAIFAEINTMGGIACGVAGAAGMVALVWVRAGEAA